MSRRLTCAVDVVLTYAEISTVEKDWAIRSNTRRKEFAVILRLRSCNEPSAFPHFIGTAVEWIEVRNSKKQHVYAVQVHGVLSELPRFYDEK